MSTALYRRYRPESFVDVIGQEHVTEPLMQALRSERVNHAYLFSGPRGCGKTTSARILARCLNCEQGPTDQPCGTCDSCVALARDGAGSVDVIEIDAASHGRVDDTRELRERAAFGPAQSRFKVYIIDEAHMVSREGFNSLLKIVEEPPPHVKFIFATTEPEKVLATIRSRTHHYPFHLVPPQRLTAYLEQLCEQEGVTLEPGVLSFVTRAGGGSVRDSLSVLDQLISGAGEQGLTYERTAALLGFTDVELLDAVVEAVAAGDAATVFAQVDRVMESGHDPRRFVEDLLERYRDLIVLAAVGEQAGGLLPGLPEDQVERMRRQAGAYGAAGLSRSADLVSKGLSEMTGAVSYRLMLELLAARLLLPAASGEEGYAARLDRIERRLGAGGTTGAGGATGAATGGAQPGEASRTGAAPAGASPRQRAQAAAGVGAAGQERGPATGDDGAGSTQGGGAPRRQEAGSAGRDASAPEPESGATTTGEPATRQEAAGQEAAGQGEAEQQAPGHLDTAALRRHWPDIITAVREISRRTAGALESMQVVDFDGRRLLVGMPDERWIRHFMGTSNEEALRQGVLDALALDTRIEATVTGGPSGGGVDQRPPAGPGGPQHGGGGQPASAPSGASRAAGQGAAAERRDTGRAPQQTRPEQGRARPEQGARSAEVPPPDDEPPPAEPPPDDGPPHDGPPEDGPPEDGPPAHGRSAGAPPADAPRGDASPPPGEQRHTGAAAGAGSATSAATGGTAATADPTPHAPSALPDTPQRGRLRTRSRPGEAGAVNPPPTPKPTTPVRVRGRSRGGATQPSTPADAALAEQLGAGATAGGATAVAAADRPDWSQAARSGEAPAWATGESVPEPGAAANGVATASPTPGGDAPSVDDEDLATSGAVGQPVIENVLGGTVIAINDDPVG